VLFARYAGQYRRFNDLAGRQRARPLSGKTERLKSFS
jgi:hypothetical protein